MMRKKIGGSLPRKRISCRLWPLLEPHALSGEILNIHLVHFSSNFLPTILFFFHIHLFFFARKTMETHTPYGFCFGMMQSASTARASVVIESTSDRLWLLSLKVRLFHSRISLQLKSTPSMQTEHITNTCIVCNNTPICTGGRRISSPSPYTHS
jgi:hypothetical protein